MYHNIMTWPALTALTFAITSTPPCVYFLAIIQQREQHRTPLPPYPKLDVSLYKGLSNGYPPSLSPISFSEACIGPGSLSQRECLHEKVICVIKDHTINKEIVKYQIPLHRQPVVSRKVDMEEILAALKECAASTAMPTQHIVNSFYAALILTVDANKRTDRRLWQSLWSLAILDNNKWRGLP